MSVFQAHIELSSETAAEQLGRVQIVVYCDLLIETVATKLHSAVFTINIKCFYKMPITPHPHYRTDVGVRSKALTVCIYKLINRIISKQEEHFYIVYTFL